MNNKLLLLLFIIFAVSMSDTLAFYNETFDDNSWESNGVWDVYNSGGSYSTDGGYLKLTNDDVNIHFNQTIGIGENEEVCIRIAHDTSGTPECSGTAKLAYPMLVESGTSASNAISSSASEAYSLVNEVCSAGISMDVRLVSSANTFGTATNGWNTYCWEWTPTQLISKINGVTANTETLSNIYGSYYSTSWQYGGTQANYNNGFELLIYGLGGSMAPTWIDWISFNTYGGAPPSIYDNFSTIESGSFSFNNTVSIGNSYGVVNSITIESENDIVPFYYSSSITTKAVSAASALCKITVDGIDHTNPLSRTLNANTYGNLKLVTLPLNLTLGNHTINTECRKSGGSNYEIINSQMTQFHLLDTNTNSSVNFLSINTTVGFPVNTVETLLSSFIFTTTNTTNTTNINNIIVHGRVTYSYDNADNITTYLKVQETGEVCGNFTRGSSSVSTGSLGTACSFSSLNSSTGYNFSFYGYTEVGTGAVTNVLMNVYELKLNESAINRTTLLKTIPSNITTEVGNITISNVLGGSYNVFVDAGMMMHSNITQDSYFFIENSLTSIRYYRTLSNDELNGNVNTQFVFSESGTGTHTYSLKAFCPSGCEIVQGELTAFITDAESVSTGVFDITAYNIYNSTNILVFNATIGGAIFSTTNGTITAIGEGITNVIIDAENFFSNSTNHDTTTAFNASLVKYVEIRANNNLGDSIFSFNVSMIGYNFSTTNGVAYLPTISNTSVSFFGTGLINSSAIINQVQYYNFTAFISVDVNFNFFDEETLLPVNDVSFDLLGAIFSNNFSTGAGNDYYIFSLPEDIYEIRYTANNYTARSYYVSIPHIDSGFANLSLYLIKEPDSQLFLRTITDQGNNPLIGYYLEIQRPYPSEDNTSLIYRTVEIATIDNQGDAVFTAIPNTQQYRFRILNTLLQLTNTLTPSYLVDTGSSIIAQDALNPMDNFNTATDVVGSVIYQNTTNSFIFDYTAPITIIQACLEVENNTGFEISTQTICSTSNTGTLIIIIDANSSSNYIATGFIYPSSLVKIPVDNAQKDFSFAGSRETVRYIGAFLYFITLVMCATIGGFKQPVPAIVLALGATAAFGIGFLGLFTFSTFLIGGLLVVSVIVLLLLRESDS